MTLVPMATQEIKWYTTGNAYDLTLSPSASLQCQCSYPILYLRWGRELDSHITEAGKTCGVSSSSAKVVFTQPSGWLMCLADSSWCLKWYREDAFLPRSPYGNERRVWYIKYLIYSIGTIPIWKQTKLLRGLCPLHYPYRQHYSSEPYTTCS